MNTAKITHVFNGVQQTTYIEDDTGYGSFLARVVGRIEGITLAGEHVTGVQTTWKGME